MSKKRTQKSAVTLQAILGSIKKWERIVASPRGQDCGSDNCPLCKVFYEHYCAGCPVDEETDQDSCFGSPYTEWSIHQYEGHLQHTFGSRVPGCKECLRLAKAELAFLRGLLPKVKRATIGCGK